MLSKVLRYSRFLIRFVTIHPALFEVIFMNQATICRLVFQATDKDYVQQGAWPEFSRFAPLEQLVLTRSLPFSACDLNILFLEPNTL